MKKLSLIAAIREYLMLPSETLESFRMQFKALTNKDKEDLVQYFQEVGVTIERN